MKEIIAIIRLNRIQKTKDALLEIDCPSMTVNKVLGRGKQKGLQVAQVELNPGEAKWRGWRMAFIPKRMISIVAADEQVNKIVETIMEVSRTGKFGDGRIFVCPVEDAIRVRTGEHGEDAI